MKLIGLAIYFAPQLVSSNRHSGYTSPSSTMLLKTPLNHALCFLLLAFFSALNSQIAVKTALGASSRDAASRQV